ncbi:MAG: HAD family phosphatase [Patescibacteria group bacterium]|jgi:HAD superfamily hydrolase (TIGR01509 family)
MITAIIFDMNGVIINDEAIHELAFKEVCKKYNIILTSQGYKDLCMGKTDEQGFIEIIKKYKLDNVKISNLVEQKSTKYLELIPKNIKSYPGVIDLIKKLHKKFILALASSSSRQEIEMVLNYFKIKKLFKIIISADDISKSKPDPEPYLLTTKKINQKPENCLVIEDSKSGIMSAKRAGMKCIAITTTHNEKELVGADVIINKFSEITEKMIQNV